MNKHNDLEQQLREIDVKQVTISEARKADMRQKMAYVIANSEPEKRPQPKRTASPTSWFALPTALVAIFALVGVLVFVLNDPSNIVLEGIGRIRQGDLPTEMAEPGANLLRNPNFSSGESAWWDERLGRVIDGEMCMSIPDGSENRWDAILKQEYIPYQKGKTYTIAFDGYVANRDEVPLAFTAEIGSEPYTVLFNEGFTLTNEQRRYTFTFTSIMDSTERTKQGALVIQMGAEGEVNACFDNFEVIEQDGVDEAIVSSATRPPQFKDVTAGDFPMGTAKYWNTLDMGEISSTGEMCISVPDGTEYPWDAHLVHDDLFFVEGRTYQLTFDSYAKRDDVSLRIVAGLATEPYPLFREQLETLTTTKQRYTFDFEASFNTYNMPRGGNISLQIGGQDAAEVCFDNVSVVEVE